MNKHERYKLANEKSIASKKELQMFVLSILEEEGLDSRIVNFKEEGITFKAFNQLMKAIYTVGYGDGLDGKSQLRTMKRNKELEWKLDQRHKNISKVIAENNQVDKVSQTPY